MKSVSPVSTVSTVDFSGAASTKSVKAGTSLPGTCSVGEMYFKTDATAGENLYLATATNTWTQITGAAGVNPITVLHETTYAADTVGDDGVKTLATYSMPGGTVTTNDVLRIEAVIVLASGSGGADPVFSVRIGNGGLPSFGITMDGYFQKYETEWEVTGATTIRANYGISYEVFCGGIDLAGNVDAVSDFDVSATNVIKLNTVVHIPAGRTYKCVLFRVTRYRV